MGSRASSERTRQLATGNCLNWQLATPVLMATVELKYTVTVVYLVSQSGLVKSDWSVTQKWSTGRPAGEQKV